MKLRWPCKEHVRYDSHYIKGGDRDGMLCPGGVFLPDDTLIIEDRGDAVEQIGLITTDPRWAHVETPLLLEFALAVLDALSVREASEVDKNQLEVPFKNDAGLW